MFSRVAQTGSLRAWARPPAVGWVDTRLGIADSLQEGAPHSDSGWLMPFFAPGIHTHPSTTTGIAAH